MRSYLAATFGIAISSVSASADELGYFQTLFGELSVETRTFAVHLAPVDHDIRFSIALTNKETGIQRFRQFDAPVPEIPVPIQMQESNFCDTPVVLLTVEYPWRHDWPQVLRTMETYAFRESDFAFIDVAFGPLTDIALADDTAYDPADLDMLPQIRVRCLTGRNGKPFEFVEKETK